MYYYGYKLHAVCNTDGKISDFELTKASVHDIYKQQILFNHSVRLLAADSIDATNANRKLCTKRGITTSFVRKGRAGKDEEQVKIMRSAL